MPATRARAAQTSGRVLTPPHRKFKKNAPDWYEEMYERQRKEHSSRRIRVEQSNAHDLWIGLRDGTRRAYLPE